MFNPASTGYTVDDLDWLRNEFYLAAHLEFDSGSLVVSPATDEHGITQDELVTQAVLQLQAAGHGVLPSMPWTVPGGTGTS